MYINRGKDKFMMLDISADEMAAIFDAFNSGNFNMTSALNKSDEEFIAFTHCKPDKIEDMRNVLKSKITYYQLWIEKIKKFYK